MNGVLSGMSLQGPDLVVVGSMNADVVVEVERIPRPGDTVLGSNTQISPGGKGGNVAVAAAKAGAQVAFVGAVGEDDHAGMLENALLAAGVDVTHLHHVQAPTGTAYITIDAHGENAIVVAPGANAALSASEVDAAADTLSVAAVVFGVLEVPMDALSRAAGHARRMVLNASPVQELPDPLLRRLDPLIVNRGEAIELAGVDGSDDHLLDALLGKGVRSVVITLGSAGAIGATAHERFIAAAPEVDVVDTTGAGDTLAGVLCHHLAQGLPLPEALPHAVASAADSVTRRGAQG